MSQRLPAVKPKEILRALLRAGFFIHHTSGSHHILKHPDKLELRVTVAIHGKDLKRKMLASYARGVYEAALDYACSLQPAIAVFWNHNIAKAGAPTACSPAVARLGRKVICVPF